MSNTQPGGAPSPASASPDGSGNGASQKRGDSRASVDAAGSHDELDNGVVVLPRGRRTARPRHQPTEQLTGEPAQYQAVEQAIRDLLNAFGVNWEDPHYTETPARVAKAYLEYWASGYGRDPRDEITVFANDHDAHDMVMVKDMRFYSLCSHHLAPIEGYAAIAYIPDQYLLGLSKLGRILEIYARRFQLQERIGQQTADALMELLRPKGVMVVLYNVKHGCMSSRGVKLHESSTTTSAIRGSFRKDAALRAEAMSLLSLETPGLG
ncbi:MAG: GTP cyclohydrolase I FolE [Pseudomonadota bacterium]